MFLILNGFQFLLRFPTHYCKVACLRKGVSGLGVVMDHLCLSDSTVFFAPNYLDSSGFLEPQHKARHGCEEGDGRYAYMCCGPQSGSRVHVLNMSQTHRLHVLQAK